MATFRSAGETWRAWSEAHPIASFVIGVGVMALVLQPIVRLVSPYTSNRRDGWDNFMFVVGSGMLLGAIEVVWIYLNPSLPPKHPAAERRAARYIAVTGFTSAISLVWMSYRL